jgi:acetyl-CoA carboxylase beta subunit
MLSSLKEGQANITIGGVTASFGMLGDIIIGDNLKILFISIRNF